MRSTQSLALARMSGSFSRSTDHPALRRYPSLRRSLACCFSVPCQYVPSASTASLYSGKARSTTNGPIPNSEANGISRRVNSSWSASSIELVRGQMLDVYDPWQRREQKRNSCNLAGLTRTVRPHHSQLRSSLRNRGCAAPLSRLRPSLAHSREQYFASALDGTTLNVQLQTPQTILTGSLALWAFLPRHAALANLTFSRDLGFGNPVCTAIDRQDREQYLPRPLAIREGEFFDRNPFPQCWQVASIMTLFYHSTKALA